MARKGDPCARTVARAAATQRTAEDGGGRERIEWHREERAATGATRSMRSRSTAAVPAKEAAPAPVKEGDDEEGDEEEEAPVDEDALGGTPVDEDAPEDAPVEEGDDEEGGDEEGDDDEEALEQATDGFFDIDEKRWDQEEVDEELFGEVK